MAYIYSALIMGAAALVYSSFSGASVLFLIGLFMIELALAVLLYLSKRYRIYGK